MAIATSQRKVDGGKIKGSQNVPSCIEVRMLASIPNGKTISWVAHGRYATAPTDMQTLANSLYTAIGSAWAANLAPLCPTDTSFIRVNVRDMTSFLNPVFESVGAAHDGTGVESPMPADSAIVLTEQISLRGKGLKGRMFLGGFSTLADGGAGMIAGPAITAATAFGTGIFNALNSNNLTPCIAQVARQEYIGLDGAHHNQRTANANTLVSSYICKDAEWDSQRRRGN